MVLQGIFLSPNSKPPCQSHSRLGPHLAPLMPQQGCAEEDSPEAYGPWTPQKAVTMWTEHFNNVSSRVTRSAGHEMNNILITHLYIFAQMG